MLSTFIVNTWTSAFILTLSKPPNVTKKTSRMRDMEARLTNQWHTLQGLGSVVLNTNLIIVTPDTLEIHWLEGGVRDGEQAEGQHEKLRSC